MIRMRLGRKELLAVAAAIVLSCGGATVAVGDSPSPFEPPPASSERVGSSRALPTQPTNPYGEYRALSTPCRLYDSRLTGGILAAGSTRVVPIADKCGLPTGAITPSALVGTIASTGSTNNGYFVGYAAGTAKPVASFLNWTAKQTTSTAFTLPVSASGLAVFAYSQSHLVVDVVGFQTRGVHGEVVTGPNAATLSGAFETYPDGGQTGRALIALGTSVTSACTVSARPRYAGQLAVANLAAVSGIYFARVESVQDLPPFTGYVNAQVYVDVFC